MRDEPALRAFVVKRRNDKQGVRSERREKSAKSHSRFRVVRAAADDDGDAPVRGFYRKLHDVDFFVFRHRCGFARGAEYNKSAHVVFNLKIDEAPERIVIDARIGKRGNKRGSAAFEN